MRVVSLVPSVTETLLAWGVEVVACTRFCEQPALHHVGGTKDPDVAAVVSLRPDLVVVDTEENRREDHAALLAAGLGVHVTSVRSLADVAPTLSALAAAVGVPAPVAAPSPPPVGDGGPAVAAAGRRAFVPVWRRPWVTVNGGTYASTLLEAAGVGNVFADHPDRYPEVDDHEIVAAHPDLVVAPSEPYPFGERHRAELERYAPEVLLVDGQDVTWWGVRTAAALERLGAVLARRAGR